MISAPLWIVFIGSLTLGGAIDDALARKPAWYVSYGLLSGILCALFVAVNFELLSYDGSGLMLLGLAVATGAWLIYEVTFDITLALRRRASQSQTSLAAAVAMGVLCFPAVALGAMQGWGLLA